MKIRYSVIVRFWPYTNCYALALSRVRIIIMGRVIISISIRDRFEVRIIVMLRFYI